MWRRTMRSAFLEHPNEDDDDYYDEQQVDGAPGNIESNSYQPQDQQNDDDESEHYSLLLSVEKMFVLFLGNARSMAFLLSFHLTFFLACDLPFLQGLFARGRD